ERTGAPVRALVHLVAHALDQLGGRLLGEGDRGHALDAAGLVLERPEVACHQHARLSRARGCAQEHEAREVESAALLLGEIVRARRHRVTAVDLEGWSQVEPQWSDVAASSSGRMLGKAWPTRASRAMRSRASGPRQVGRKSQNRHGAPPGKASRVVWN